MQVYAAGTATGNFIDSRRFEEHDRPLYEKLPGKVRRRLLTRYGFEEDVLWRLVFELGIVVCFQVREVFVQTPGPSAGTWLLPQEEV